MELIGPHQILRPLADLPLHGGQQLRGHGRVQYVLQHVVKLRLLPVLGEIAHQMPDQGLGDGGVDAVHAHVVPIVGTPAQGQLAEVPGADDQAAAFVGNVHEDLRPLPGLGVLVGDGVVLRVVADVPEVAADRLGDVHGPQACPHLLRQKDGVVLRPVRGAEARHGDGDDIRQGAVQQLHGKARNQHRQGGVQSAGKTYHGGFRPGVLQAPLEAQGGQEENLPAAGVPVLLPLGDEGHGGDVAGELGLPHAEGEAHPLSRVHAVHSLGPAALTGQALDVDFGNQQPAVKPALRQHGPIFRNQLMGAEHQVGGGLARPGAGIGIAAKELGALHGNQLAAVGVLPHHVVAGGEVSDEKGPLLRHLDGRALRRPEVLADFKAQGQLRYFPAPEELPRAEEHRLPAHAVHKEGLAPRSGGKPALLIKLAVIGQMGLGDGPQNYSFLYHDRAVIQFVMNPQRNSQGGDHLQVPGGLQNRFQGLLRVPKQRLLEKEVPAGVARQAQLRQDQDLHPRLLGGAHHLKGLFGVVGAVRQPQLRRAAGHGDKSILHTLNLPYGIVDGSILYCLSGFSKGGRKRGTALRRPAAYENKAAPLTGRQRYPPPAGP